MTGNNQKKHSTSFSKLALALANDYSSIYVIDSSDDSYVEYTAEGGEKALVVRSRGDNFFVDLKKNCRELVWPEDQETFLKELKKERVVEKLEKGVSFGLRYRLNIDGVPVHYFLKTIREDSNDIIIGVQNIDEQVKIYQKDKDDLKTYSEIAKSLAGMYEAIYYIDINTGHYIEYYSSQSYSELGIDSGGENFFEKVKHDIQVHIFEEDREMLVQNLDRDFLLARLEEKDTYSIVYRQFIDGKMQYLNILVFKQENEDDHIVIGVRNINEQKVKEADSLVYGHIAGSLASRYEVIYYIDIDSNEYTQYNAGDMYGKLVTTKKGQDFFNDTVEAIEKTVHDDDKDRILTVMEKNHLLDIMAQEGALAITYRQVIDGQSRYLSMLVVRPKNDEKHLVMGITNIDAQIKREQYIKSESQTLSEISMELTERYEVIYLVNIKTDEYMEYSSSDRYSRLKIDKKGENFFEETQKNMKTDIYSEDYKMMSIAMDKDFLMESLKESGKFIINYRLILDGRPQYVTLFAVRPKKDKEHIIIAVANIDSTRRRELLFEDAMGAEMDMANHDPLTGLKNKRAYAQAEMILDDSISEDDKKGFAILIADINGLKEINETQGIKIGDSIIQEVSKILTDIFSNSKVFRIGADVFAVIIEGEDYKARDVLAQKLEDIQAEKQEMGLPTISYGMADYSPMLDIKVQDVYNRAEQVMLSKRQLDQETDDKDVIQRLGEYEKDIKYFRLFEDLISSMAEIHMPDISRIEKNLIEISSMYRLSKAVTRVYRSALEEKKGAGETLSCYDTGIEGDEILSYRVETKVGNIVEMKVYMSKDEIPLNDTEKERVNLVMRTVVNYISRNRLRDMVEDLTYSDTEGFRNQRYMQRYMVENARDLSDKAAFKYNLKHFSLVNSEVGRELGDVVMRRHFEQLESIIGDRGTVSRLGGDNFIGICGKEQLGQVLTYLTEANVIYDTREGKNLNISASVGVFRIPEDYDAKHIGEIMEKINIAFSAAQNGGKESIVFFDGKLVKNKEGSMKVQQRFPEALRNEEFKVYYQPKVDIRTGKIVGAEALCRWFHKGKMVSPGEFIPALEETNDICKLDFYMLDHVCRDIRKWMDEGRKIVRVSVNLSRKHMLNVNLVDNLLKIIDRHNIPHSSIEIELTETTSDVGFGDLKRVVTGLQSVGIYTSVDDFGVGYSSLNLIRELPWNVIKVDKSFLPVGDAVMDDVTKIMFRHVILMTTEMGIECIVEGVETEKQLAILRENNCNYAQGFLYDRPLPKEDFEARLSEGAYAVY